MKYHKFFLVALTLISLILAINHFKPNIYYDDLIYASSIAALTIIMEIVISLSYKYRKPHIIYRFSQFIHYSVIKAKLKRIAKQEPQEIKQETQNQINEMIIRISLEDLRSLDPQKKHLGLMNLYSIGQDAPYEIQDQIYKGLISSLEAESDELFKDAILDTICRFRKHRKAI